MARSDFRKWAQRQVELAYFARNVDVGIAARPEFPPILDEPFEEALVRHTQENEWEPPWYSPLETSYLRFGSYGTFRFEPDKDFAAGVRVIAEGGIEPSTPGPVVKPEWEGKPMEEVITTIRSREIERGNYVDPKGKTS